MAEKDCTNCVFITPPTVKGSAGRCEYPVPYWIKIHSGGGWVAGYEAQECPVFKSRLDVANEAKVTMPNVEVRGWPTTEYDQSLKRVIYHRV